MQDIEDVLNGAGVLAGKYAHYDVAAARGRIARRPIGQLGQVPIAAVRAVDPRKERTTDDAWNG